jgi:lipopolysaccharide transport system ATP-binding protein
LENGSIRMLGEPDTVITQYLAAMIEKDSAYLTARHTEIGEVKHAQVLAPEVVDVLPNIDHRFGDERAKVMGIAVLDANGQPLSLLEPDSNIVVRISVQAQQDILLPIVGFMMRNHMGLDFAGSNTAREETDLPPMAAGDVYTVDFHLQLPQLYPSVFTFSPAIADGTLHSYRMCDWVDNAIALQMAPGESEVYGHLHLPCKVEVNRRLGQHGPTELGPAERKLA